MFFTSFLSFNAQAHIIHKSGFFHLIKISGIHSFSQALQPPPEPGLKDYSIGL